MNLPPNTTAADSSDAMDSSGTFSSGPAHSSGPPVPPPPIAPPPPDTNVAKDSGRDPVPQPPPAPPRATLPPVQPPSPKAATAQPPSLTNGDGATNASVPDAPQPARSRKPKQPARGAKIAAANQTENAEFVAVEVSPSTPPKSRWRTEVRAEPKDETESDQEDELAPVKRSVPAWLVSMVFHLVVLLVLALLTTPVGEGIGSMVLEFGEATESENFELENVNIQSSDSIVDSTSDLDSEMVVDTDIQSLMDTIELPSETLKTLEMVQVESGVGPASDAVKPMFGGRSGAMKSALIAAYGGTQETLNAVERGLQWLAKNQERSGSWSMAGPYSDAAPFSENRCAATAMAMLAFQGDGNTHLVGPYAKNVERGLRTLLKGQRRDGFLATNVRGDDQQAYGHAQATIALCELFAMTDDSALRGPAQAAVDYCVNAQSAAGGWRYRPRLDSDLSVTGWYVMALTSAESAGLEVPASTLRMANTYLDTVQMYDGSSYSYQPNRPASYAMTAEGLLCRQYLGWPQDEEALTQGINDLVHGGMLDPNNPNVYYWYYATQAMHHYGGEPWQKWNGVMRVELPRLQLKRGAESGSWSPQADEWGRRAGRLYVTCLSIYCLEVYYRHLPLYDKHGK
ncbi:prenyltransferase/squalene oxidase repeat-containing protein [Rhodopirellula baltica]|uniref:prenyltransferase/squalene oxidase repeat-containing protein n=1 Tax=Rhodopirellula baltica TaxID=265606 RepID=UPI0002DE79E1|nr:prenyltransferase/squalene oxidase repeat-containing protein [Rhodopirellula baltica]